MRLRRRTGSLFSASSHHHLLRRKSITVRLHPPREPELRPPPRHEPSSKPTFNNPLGNLFDGDMKLIIAMMLLLSGDGGDMLLLMALMYIML